MPGDYRLRRKTPSDEAERPAFRQFLYTQQYQRHVLLLASRERWVYVPLQKLLTSPLHTSSRRRASPLSAFFPAKHTNAMDGRCAVVHLPSIPDGSVVHQWRPPYRERRRRKALLSINSNSRLRKLKFSTSSIGSRIASDCHGHRRSWSVPQESPHHCQAAAGQRVSATACSLHSNSTRP